MVSASGEPLVSLVGVKGPPLIKGAPLTGVCLGHFVEMELGGALYE